MIGRAGSGKSTAIRTLLKEDGTFKDNVFMIRMGRKPLPFKNKLKAWDKETKTGDFMYSNDGDTVAAIFDKFANEYGKKIIIVDDSTFAMTDYFMKTAMEAGFNKFNINAVKYYNMLKAAAHTPDDIRVYMVNHIEEDANGNLKVKTIGKMLDEKVDIPSLLTVVLQAEKTKDGYKFKTNQEVNRDICKSPMGLFSDQYIDNDLQAVDNAICDYYGYEPI